MELVIYLYSLESFTNSIVDCYCNDSQTAWVFPKAESEIGYARRAFPLVGFVFFCCCCIIIGSIWYVSNCQSCIRMKEVNIGQALEVSWGYYFCVSTAYPIFMETYLRALMHTYVAF